MLDSRGHFTNKPNIMISISPKRVAKLLFCWASVEISLNVRLLDGSTRVVAFRRWRDMRVTCCIELTMQEN